jgi:hypothetical protein
MTISSVTPNTTYYLLVTGWQPANYGSFNIQAYIGNQFPLKIKLKDISASNSGTRNRIDWSTEFEIKGDEFELERSADGKNFMFLSKLPAKSQASSYC